MAHVPFLRVMATPHRGVTLSVFVSPGQHLAWNRQHRACFSLPRLYSSRPVFTPLIIDGQERPANSSEVFEVHRSHSDTLVETAASATIQDCHDAINAASQAFKTWETSRLVDRRDIFIRAAELLKSAKYSKLLQAAYNDEVAFAPYWGKMDKNAAVQIILAQLACMDQLKGESYSSSLVSGAEVFVHRRAKGVV